MNRILNGGVDGEIVKQKIQQLSKLWEVTQRL